MNRTGDTNEADETTPTDGSEVQNLRAAAGGDHDAFMRAVTPYRLELHRHCYRMTGSLDDADDILQETLFRAWRSLGTYAGRSSFRAWLYRIATNRSIDTLGGKSRQEIAVEWEGYDLGLEPMWLQPYPDDNPAELNERREHIGTAFVVAIQLLPPKQRAALLLKDVLGFSVPDVAAALDTTTASVNSALQRARAAVASASPPRPSTEAEANLRDQLIDAWQRADIDALTNLMATDVVLTMPPDPIRFDGIVAIVDFLTSVAPDGRLDQLVYLPTTANRQPAVALYVPTEGDETGDYTLGGMMNLDVVDTETGEERVSRLRAFRLPPGRWGQFGLLATQSPPNAS